MKPLGVAVIGCGRFSRVPLGIMTKTIPAPIKPAAATWTNMANVFRRQAL